MTVEQLSMHNYLQTACGSIELGEFLFLLFSRRDGARYFPVLLVSVLSASTRLLIIFPKIWIHIKLQVISPGEALLVE